MALEVKLFSKYILSKKWYLKTNEDIKKDIKAKPEDTKKEHTDQDLLVENYNY